jgi:hypothetical protein
LRGLRTGKIVSILIVDAMSISSFVKSVITTFFPLLNLAQLGLWVDPPLTWARCQRKVKLELT